MMKQVLLQFFVDIMAGNSYIKGIRYSYRCQAKELNVTVRTNFPRKLRYNQSASQKVQNLENGRLASRRQWYKF